MRIFLKLFLFIFFSTFFISKAFSEVSISGYQEFFAGSADQSTRGALDMSTNTGVSQGGLSNGSYTRLVATASATLDSGIEVTGVYSIMKDDKSGGDTDVLGVSTNQNDVSLSGGFGTFTIGNTGSTGSMMHYRASTIIPTAEPDGGVIGHFYSGGSNDYGRADEVGYAEDSMKARYMSNVYEGFSFGIQYGSSLRSTPARSSGDDKNCSTASDQTGHGCYTDVIDAVVKYEGTFDGVAVGATYGMVGGNTNIIAGSEYNDLEGTVYTANLGYGGLTVQYKYQDMDDSGQLKSTTDDGANTGSTICGVYAAGNVSAGICGVETEFQESGVSSKNDSKTMVYGLGYNFGGGVMLEAAFFSVEQSQGSTKDTDADGVISKISFGF